MGGRPPAASTRGAVVVVRGPRWVHASRQAIKKYSNKNVLEEETEKCYDSN